MACPCFEPLEWNRGPRRTQDSMLPLGDCWQGECHAQSGTPFLPSAHTLRTLCNLGYARDNCAHFPSGQSADAVRFTVARDDGEGSIRLYYVVERDHLPLSHGPLEYSRATGAIGGSAEPAVAGLALAYVRSYLRLKACAFGR